MDGGCIIRTFVGLEEEGPIQRVIGSGRITLLGGLRTGMRSQLTTKLGNVWASWDTMSSVRECGRVINVKMKNAFFVPTGRKLNQETIRLS